MTRNQSVKLLKYISLAGVYGGLLMPLVFIPSVIFPFVFSKLIAFQILVGVTFPAYLILAWMEPKYRPKKHILYSAILAYFVALALSVVFAVDPFRAWWGNQERMNGLFTLLHFLAWLTMAIGVLKTWEAWRRLLNFQVALSGVMAIVAIMQKFNPNLLLFPAGQRVGGLLDNPIYMGAYQIFNLFFLALLAWKVKDRRWWWMYGGIAILDIIAFVLAQSRGALLGLGVGLIVFVGFVGVFHKKKTVKLGLLGGLVALFAVYGALFAFRSHPAVEASPLSRYVNVGSSFETRFIAWEIAWDGFLQRPLTGWGLDNFHIVFDEHYNPESLRYGEYETWFDRAHNTVMDVLSMTGILGFLTFIFIFIALFYSVVRAYKKGWIDLPIAAILFSLPLAYFFQNLFVFDHPAGFSMSYLMYALTIAATQGVFVGVKEESDEQNTDKGKKTPPWIAFGVLQVIALILVWRTSVLPFKVSQISIESNKRIATNFNEGLDLAKEASAIWTPYTDEQSFLLSRNLVQLAGQRGFTDLPRWREAYDFAKELNKRELERHPQNTHTIFIYARLLNAFAAHVPEDIPRAEQLYLDAIDTSPKRQQLHYGLARLYFQTGQTEAALNVIKRVRDFDLELGEGRWRYGVAMMYDAGQLQLGAEEVAASQSVAYPYGISSGRELIPLFDAYLILGDTEAMNDLISRLDRFPLAEERVYAQAAVKYTLNGYEVQKEAISEFATRHYPDFEETFVQLLSEAAEQADQNQQNSAQEDALTE